MKEIIRIVVKGSSGFCPLDEAYDDKITITLESISYEYKPVRETDTNTLKKWSYRTNSPIFKEQYKKISDLVFEVFDRDVEIFYCDIGSIEFIITYSDKQKLHKKFYLPSDEFAEQFKQIKMMVPICEYTPAVLLTSEDFDNEGNNL